MSTGTQSFGLPNLQTGSLVFYGSGSSSSLTVSTNETVTGLGIGLTPVLGALTVHAATNKNIVVDIGDTIAGTPAARISALNDAANANTVLELQGTTISLNSTTGATAMQFKQYGAGTLTTDGSGNITATSDVRLKKVVSRFRAGLREICQITPIRFRWKKKSGMDTKAVYAGFSAQDVQKAIPGAVGLNPDGTLTIQDRALIAALVNAVQEQQQEIERLARQLG